jgi:acetyltransferase-like isoleucine patch superfamily enzyme
MTRLIASAFGSALVTTPWKARNELWRWLAYPQIRLLFALNGIPWGVGWRIYGVPVIQRYRGSTMEFGQELSLRSSTRSNPLGPNHAVILSTLRAGAALHVGARFAMTGGSVCAARAIWIGDDVAVGANALVVDTDFHPLEAEARKATPNEGASMPIRIEDGVFIGTNAIILKGSWIGCGSVIGAGSVVAGEIPPRVVAAGNPARVLHELGRGSSPAGRPSPTREMAGTA